MAPSDRLALETIHRMMRPSRQDRLEALVDNLQRAILDEDHQKALRMTRRLERLLSQEKQ